MAEKRDYYEVLSVGREATEQEIKSSYRKLAIQYHPDRNPGDREAEEKFKEAAEAYAVLSDSQKRAQYDRFGHQGVRGAPQGFDPTVFADFSDILGDLFGFGDLFGGRRRSGGAPPGADLRYDLEVSFEEAAFGKEVTLRVPRLERCESCSGSGSAGGRPPATCQTCAGRGQVRFSQGFFTVARTCPQCHGGGTVIEDPCADCSGSGLVQKERSLQLRIPAGVDSGARLRLQGEGEHGRLGGPPGDLYVVIEVQEHERFARSGADVLSIETIAYPQAVLGTTLEVDTIHGTETLDVPPGTQHGARFRLRGKGVPHLGRSSHGDHWIEVRLEVPAPADLREDEMELLRKLAEITEVEVKERNVFERVKDLFH